MSSELRGPRRTGLDFGDRSLADGRREVIGSPVHPFTQAADEHLALRRFQIKKVQLAEPPGVVGDLGATWISHNLRIIIRRVVAEVGAAPIGVLGEPASPSAPTV